MTDGSTVCYIDTSVLLANTTSVQFIPPHPGPDWRIFYLTSEDIDDVISRFSRLFVQTVSLTI